MSLRLLQKTILSYCFRQIVSFSSHDSALKNVLKLFIYTYIPSALYLLHLRRSYPRNAYVFCLRLKLMLTGNPFQIQLPVKIVNVRGPAAPSCSFLFCPEVYFYVPLCSVPFPSVLCRSVLFLCRSVEMRGHALSPFRTFSYNLCCFNFSLCCLVSDTALLTQLF